MLLYYVKEHKCFGEIFNFIYKDWDIEILGLNIAL